MKVCKNKLMSFFLASCLFSFTSLLFIFFVVQTEFSAPHNKVLAQEESLTVNASVQPCILVLLFQPANRSVNNYSTTADVSIRFSGTDNIFHNFIATTNNFGSTTYDFCGNSIYPTSGNYNFLIRGESHLRKRINGVVAFTSATTTTDLRSPSNLLIAGETSNIFDNKINSLDISTQIRFLNSTNVVNDLNRDGVVNQMDLDITRNNFFMIGDN